MVKSETARIYTFNVVLQRDCRVWRRIEARGDQTLDHLHQAVFQAFGRYDEHLYSFYFEPASGYRPARGHSRKAVEFTHPYCFEGSDIGPEEERYNAADTPIDSLHLRHGRKLAYLFDFGDSWWHEITVEKTNGTPTAARYPRVVEKHGKSPPQYPIYDE